MIRSLSTVLLVALLFDSATAASVTATYRFGNNLNADEPGVASLTSINPIGSSGFSTDIVFGVSQSVWAFDGNASPSTQQAGLSLNTSGLITPDNYSLDMIFQFPVSRANSWARVIDVENRQSDDGLYVNNVNQLDLFPPFGNDIPWSDGVYHHIVLTNSGVSTSIYSDTSGTNGTVAGSLMNLNNPNNPGLLINFFLDNLAGAGQGDYSDGRVAFIRLWDGVLSPDEAHQVANGLPTPEPSWLALLVTFFVLTSPSMSRVSWYN